MRPVRTEPQGSREPGRLDSIALDVRYMDMVAKVQELQPRPQTPGLSVPIEAMEALK